MAGGERANFFALHFDSSCVEAESQQLGQQRSLATAEIEYRSVEQLRQGNDLGAGSGHWRPGSVDIDSSEHASSAEQVVVSGRVESRFHRVAPYFLPVD